MYDELTEVDIRKMEEEISYRTAVLRPKLIEDVQIARGFGDLSENFEYKCAKRDKNRNDSRIRYLQKMIQTAKIIQPDTVGAADKAGLFDTVVIVPALTGVPQTIRIVTTLRQDALKGLISKESPVARAVLGHRAGEVVHVDLGEGRGYELTIQSIEKGTDDPSLDISGY
ncbi:GreA/GreB family elongation factor [Oscillibacter sp.]|uniref:GreA/GreB family elongation factor n=1 Tax=Oscillibacter sp. TaxID=1945593 RepID=UPI00289A47E7|nr:GreA/GreB family elongation factor [Oscillibacter sp.]